jgi:hypothetical protein
MSTDENQFRRVEWSGDEPLPSDDDDADGMPLQPPGAGLSAEDLELLTLAARALGAERIEVVERESWVNLYFNDRPPAYSWNPLLHGDDTFNLQVDLRMWVRVDSVKKRSGVALGDVLCTEYWDQHPDARAATRRAVTRAAAETAPQRS